MECDKNSYLDSNTKSCKSVSLSNKDAYCLAYTGDGFCNKCQKGNFPKAGKCTANIIAI